MGYDPEGIIPDPTPLEIRTGARNIARKFIDATGVTDYAGILEKDLESYSLKYWQIWGFFPIDTEERLEAEKRMAYLWTQSVSCHRAVESLNAKKEN